MLYLIIKIIIQYSKRKKKMNNKTKKDEFQGVRSIINSNNEFRKIKNSAGDPLEKLYKSRDVAIDTILKIQEDYNRQPSVKNEKRYEDAQKLLKMINSEIQKQGKEEEKKSNKPFLSFPSIKKGKQCLKPKEIPKTPQLH